MPSLAPGVPAVIPSGSGAPDLTGSTGIVVQTATGTYTARTITGTANQITVTNGDGVAGNPTLSIPSAFQLPGTINKLTLTQPATGATLTLADGKTLTASDTTTLATSSITFAGGAVITFGTRSQTLSALTTADALSDWASSPSATSQKAQSWQFLSGQTANLNEWQNNFGAVKFAIGPSGNRLNYGGVIIGTAPATPTFSSAARAGSTTCVITTTDNPHKITVGSWVTIANSSVAAYNGTWPVTATTSTTFSYVCLSSATDSATSITITPLGINQFGAQSDSGTAAGYGTAIALSDNLMVHTATGNTILALAQKASGNGIFLNMLSNAGTSVASVNSAGQFSSAASFRSSLAGRGFGMTVAGQICVGSGGVFAASDNTSGVAGSLDVGFSRGPVAGVWCAGNGTAGDTTAEIKDARAVSAVTDQTAIDTTTLTVVTTATRPLKGASGTTYNFELYIPITQGSVLADGLKFDMAGGTATYSFFCADVEITDGGVPVAVTNSHMTAANTAVSLTSPTSGTTVALYATGTFTTSSAAAATVAANLAKSADVGTGITPLAGRYLHIWPSN